MLNNHQIKRIIDKKKLKKEENYEGTRMYRLFIDLSLSPIRGRGTSMQSCILPKLKQIDKT